MDLIDRQALLKQIEIDSDGEPGYYGDTWKFIDTIKNLPPATDKNVGTEHGTNLAEVGTDAISRQQAINALDECYCGGEDSCGEPWVYKENAVEAIQMIEPIPSAQPEIIRCKDCKYAEYIDDVQTLWCTECGQGRTVAPYDFCSYGERREDG